MRNNGEKSYILEQRIDKSFLADNSKQILTRLDMELTERCNNNCMHCYINLSADDLAAKERELSTKEIKHILEEAASLDCLAVRFCGGEPLLREDFQELTPPLLLQPWQNYLAAFHHYKK